MEGSLIRVKPTTTPPGGVNKLSEQVDRSPPTPYRRSYAATKNIFIPQNVVQYDFGLRIVSTTHSASRYHNRHYISLASTAMDMETCNSDMTDARDLTPNQCLGHDKGAKAMNPAKGSDSKYDQIQDHILLTTVGHVIPEVGSYRECRQSYGSLPTIALQSDWFPSIPRPDSGWDIKHKWADMALASITAKDKRLETDSPAIGANDAVDSIRIPKKTVRESERFNQRLSLADYFASDDSHQEKTEENPFYRLSVLQNVTKKWRNRYVKSKCALTPTKCMSESDGADTTHPFPQSIALRNSDSMPQVTQCIIGNSADTAPESTADDYLPAVGLPAVSLPQTNLPDSYVPEDGAIENHRPDNGGLDNSESIIYESSDGDYGKVNSAISTPDPFNALVNNTEPTLETVLSLHAAEQSQPLIHPTSTSDFDMVRCQ